MPEIALVLALDGVEMRGQVRPPGPNDLVEPWQVLFEHVAVQEEQGAQSLVLGGGGDIRLDSQRAEERGDLEGPHLGGMALAVEQDVAANPRDVSLFGAATVMSGPDGLAHAVEQPRWSGRGWTAFSHHQRGIRPSWIGQGSGHTRHGWRQHSLARESRQGVAALVRRQGIRRAEGRGLRGSTTQASGGTGGTGSPSMGGRAALALRRPASAVR
jgi:hypothetical protein